MRGCGRGLRAPDLRRLARRQRGLQRLDRRRIDKAEADRPFAAFDRVVEAMRLDDAFEISRARDDAMLDPAVDDDVVKPEIDCAIDGFRRGTFKSWLEIRKKRK